ncbi:NADH-quinone oxidoreductase subunit J [Desulfobulbus rhabdoformis]|uniref:NADH-quinone oxidoreductase subunit J family protein n=1 Tax=Desulfobulbus rhabdoformis TaxID=34032 RepID=UPI001962FB9B|nr:NADH-quinone oxidoreductase subunit J [Desulfobulbus rhabdoformis]MBM9614446.1 NADH-quinone oxidoreductase subunit J [Desulfobulbus rhabdoformis]
MLFAVLAVLGAAGLVLFRHPMNGAMSFVITLISLAGLYALLSAKLIFALQLIVYAGAIMSLIVFIIMFLNIQPEDLPKEEGKLLNILGALIIVAPIGYFLVKIVNRLPNATTELLGNNFGGVKPVGLLLFKDWLVPFEIVSILLLVSLMGALLLAGKKKEVSK